MHLAAHAASDVHLRSICLGLLEKNEEQATQMIQMSSKLQKLQEQVRKHEEQSPFLGSFSASKAAILQFEELGTKAFKIDVSGNLTTKIAAAKAKAKKEKKAVCVAKSETDYLCSRLMRAELVVNSDNNEHGVTPTKLSVDVVLEDGNIHTFTQMRWCAHFYTDKESWWGYSADYTDVKFNKSLIRHSMDVETDKDVKYLFAAEPTYRGQKVCVDQLVAFVVL
jgi:hypothetical protein